MPRTSRIACRSLLAAACVAIAAPAAAQSLLVSVQDLVAMRADPKVVILHIAERASTFEEAHVPGARFVRYGDFAVEGVDNLGSELPSAETVARVFEAAGVSDDSRVVLYAQSPVIAARAFFTLDAFGHRNVALLDGGLRAWREAKQPMATGPSPQPRPGQWTPQLNAARVADATFIERRTPGRDFALIDVRPDEEFFGRHTMGGAHAAGHIAGAKQLTWNALVEDDGRFLPRAHLAQKLATAGAAPGKPVVAYCMIGMRASVVYFVSRLLSYDVKLYDGSIVDWSRRNLPVVKD